MTVVNNSLARRASGDDQIKGFESLLDGPSAVVYGKASGPAIARALMDAKKADEKLELRGIFFDGEAYAGEDGVKTGQQVPHPRRSDRPGRRRYALARQEARRHGQEPGGKIASLIKAVEEKAKEKEAAAPAAAAAPAEAAPAAQRLLELN